MLKTIFKILINRYFLAIIGFAVLMIFLDTNSLERQKVLNSRLDDIKGMITFYKAEIAKNNAGIKELETDPEAIEKYAREKYLMKRDSEDVYIIVRE
jgi:cell division protein FtsB